MKKVLVTGASGFVGSHLIDYLFEQGGYEIVGTVFGTPAHRTEGWTPVSVDLTEALKVDELVASSRPDWIIHLAALSSPAASFSDSHKTLMTNTLVQAHLLDALVAHVPHARILIVGSAEEYGKVDPNELPISETQALRPMSPYAVSKVTQDFMGLSYHLSKKVDAVRVRPFNHTGPRQTPQFVVPAFAEQIAKIEAGMQEPVLTVGNLTSTRDFSDVRDIVRAYEMAMIHGVSGEVYNIGSGREVSIQSVLDMLVALSSISITVKQDPTRMQPSDTPRLRADVSKFSTLTGWSTKVPLEQTLADVLHYWRNQVHAT